MVGTGARQEMKTLSLFLLLLLPLTAHTADWYAHLERQPDGSFESASKPWTLGEQSIAATAIACAIGDVATTVYGREQLGLREQNPLMKNYAVFVPVKALLIVAAWWIGEKTGARKSIWIAAAVPNCVVSAWNASQFGEGR